MYFSFFIHISILIFLLFFIIVRRCGHAMWIVSAQSAQSCTHSFTPYRTPPWIYAISIVVFFRNNFGYVQQKKKQKKYRLKLEILWAISIEHTIRRHRGCVHVVVCGIKESTRTSYPHDINCTDETSSDFCFPTFMHRRVHGVSNACQCIWVIEWVCVYVGEFSGCQWVREMLGTSRLVVANGRQQSYDRAILS